MVKQWKHWQTLFSWAPKSLQMVTVAMKLKDTFLERKAMTNLDSILKAETLLCRQRSAWSYGFSSSHVWMWQLDQIEGWEPKNWCFWTVVLEKTLESPLDCKEIKPVHPKGNQPWIFIRRTDAETPILWASDVKSWLIGKDPDAGKDWREEEKWVIEDELVGWHHQLNGYEFEQTLGDGEGQGSLVCCSPCGRKESDRIERLNNCKCHNICLCTHTLKDMKWR